MHANSPRTFLERARFWLLFAVTAILIVTLGALAPQQMPLLPYKLALPMLGALDFFWLDWALFPYAQPAGYLWTDWRRAGGHGADGDPDYPVSMGCDTLFCAACLRQSGMVAVGALAVSLGL